jgi:hypothetical protein
MKTFGRLQRGLDEQSDQEPMYSGWCQVGRNC